MPISLRPVTADNFDTVSDLPLLPQQRDYLASNDYSIAQASFYPETMHTRAVYCDEEVVGFLMFVSPDEEDLCQHGFRGNRHGCRWQ